MVSATVSDEERQAIADFLARKQVTKCPDGEARFAHIDWKTEPYESFVATRTMPEGEDRRKIYLKGNGQSTTHYGLCGDLVAQLKVEAESI